MTRFIVVVVAADMVSEPRVAHANFSDDSPLFRPLQDTLRIAPRRFCLTRVCAAIQKILKYG